MVVMAGRKGMRETGRKAQRVRKKGRAETRPMSAFLSTIFVLKKKHKFIYTYIFMK